MIQGTVHMIFYATSDWQSFDVALKKNQEIWTEIQYPTEWSSSIVDETLDKIVTKEKVTAKPPQNEHHLKKVKSLNNRGPKPRFFVQYRGNITQIFASRLKKLCDIQIIFKARKLRTCLPTLACPPQPFDKNLKSLVVYKVTWNACSSIYVGQTSRHVTTRISEHQKEDSPVEQHLVECCGTTHNVKWEILDACRGVEKLMTIETIYKKMLKPQLNTRDEYRGKVIDIEVLVQIQKFDF